VIDKARVVQECFQFSAKSDERRCRSDDWWKTVPSPLSGDRSDRSPEVNRLTGGTMRDVVADERRWRRPSTSATRQIGSLGEVGRSCAVPYV